MRSSTVFLVFLFVQLNYMQTRLVRLGSLFLLTFFTRMMFVKDHCFPIMNIHGRINPSPGAPHYVLCSPIHSSLSPDTITLLFNSHCLCIFSFFFFPFSHFSSPLIHISHQSFQQYTFYPTSQRKITSRNL